jgi:hypothetical protein
MKTILTKALLQELLAGHEKVKPQRALLKDTWQLIDDFTTDLVDLIPYHPIVEHIGDIDKVADKVLSRLKTYLEKPQSREEKGRAFIKSRVRERMFNGLHTSKESLEFLNLVMQFKVSKTPLKVILYGEPGSGKSSLTQCTGLDLMYIKNLDSISNTHSILGDRQIFVIDDVDLLIAKGREGSGDERKSLHNLLQILDKHDVVLTTNRLEDLDPAVTRAGRINHIIKVNYVPPEDLYDFVKVIGSEIIHDLSDIDYTQLFSFDHTFLVEEVKRNVKPTPEGRYKQCEVKAFLRRYLTCDVFSDVGRFSFEVDNDFESTAYAPNVHPLVTTLDTIYKNPVYNQVVFMARRIASRKLKAREEVSQFTRLLG